MTDLVPTADQARQLTDRIKVAVEGTWLLIQEAYTSRTWAVLGYDSWDAYCNVEFGHARLRLPREERQEVVASLRESGLSVRSIASATGLSTGTVGNTVAELSKNGQLPSRITGLDGRERPAARPASDPYTWVEPDADEIPGQSHVLEHTALETVTPTVTRRRPLPEAFADAGRDLTRAAEKLTRLAEDDRFDRNREATHHQVPELIGALEHTTRLVQAMNLPAAGASEEARRWWATSLHKISDALTGVANSLEQEQ
jgi:transposase-like protein